MSASPGHRKHPEHKITEAAVRGTVEVKVGQAIVAASNDVIRLEEDGHPARYYFSRSDIKNGKLEPSATTTECPFKGTASYFNLVVGGKQFKDAVWSYENPYDEHIHLKNRVAFYAENFAPMRINVMEQPESSKMAGHDFPGG